MIYDFSLPDDKKMDECLAKNAGHSSTVCDQG